MDQVTVFLRTSLFSYGGPDAHVPHGVMVIDGEILDRPSGGIRLRATRLMDDRGRRLSEAETILQLPWAKIDHILENPEE